jgi:hypothetical protein
MNRNGFRQKIKNYRKNRCAAVLQDHHTSTKYSRITPAIPQTPHPIRSPTANPQSNPISNERPVSPITSLTVALPRLPSTISIRMPIAELSWEYLDHARFGDVGLDYPFS